MLVSADDAAMTALAAGRPVGDLTTAPALDRPEILTMLADLARTIRPEFDPCAWLIVEHATIVGLISLIARPVAGTISIGYGIAPSLRGAGLAGRAVSDLSALAAGQHITAITAETATDYHASQRVLAMNGFRRTGTRTDAEDGPLIGWRFDVPAQG